MKLIIERKGSSNGEISSRNIITHAKPKLKLLEQVREELRANHYSRKTEEAYISWIKRYILFHSRRHPSEMGVEEIKVFISNLATNHHVSSSTQNQALQGVLYLYKNVLKKEVGWIEDIKHVSRVKHLPFVLTKDEVNKILSHLEGIPLLISKLLYGSGMRLSECLRLRVQDIDLDYRTITVRDGKGEKDRITILPDKITAELKQHIQRVKNLFMKDRTKWIIDKNFFHKQQLNWQRSIRHN